MIKGLTVNADTSRSLSRPLDRRLGNTVNNRLGFATCVQIKVHACFSNVQVFSFTHSGHIRNIQKFAPYENFPLYGIPRQTRCKAASNAFASYSKFFNNIIIPDFELVSREVLNFILGYR